MVWPFVWDLFSSTFTRYHLYLSILQNEIWNLSWILILGALGSKRVKGRGIFAQVMTGEKTNQSKGYWNQQRKLKLTTHFSEIIELKFGRKCHTLFCILKRSWAQALPLKRLATTDFRQKLALSVVKSVVKNAYFCVSCEHKFQNLSSSPF